MTSLYVCETEGCERKYKRLSNYEKHKAEKHPQHWPRVHFVGLLLAALYWYRSEMDEPDGMVGAASILFLVLGRRRGSDRPLTFVSPFNAMLVCYAFGYACPELGLVATCVGHLIWIRLHMNHIKHEMDELTDADIGFTIPMLSTVAVLWSAWMLPVVLDANDLLTPTIPDLTGLHRTYVMVTVCACSMLVHAMFAVGLCLPSHPYLPRVAPYVTLLYVSTAFNHVDLFYYAPSLAWPLFYAYLWWMRREFAK